MRKVVVTLAILGFLIIFFRDSMVWAGVKIVPTKVSREQLLKEAESLRKKLTGLIENHGQARMGLVAALGKAKQAQIIGEDFLQSEMEKILETQSVFFWNKRELSRKKFSKMSLKELLEETYGLQKSIEAVNDATAFFAERVFLLQKIIEATGSSEKNVHCMDKKYL